MSDKKGFDCKRYIAAAGFIPPGGPFPPDPEGRIVMFDEKGAVLICNRTEPHKHEWPDDYAPVNPKNR